MWSQSIPSGLSHSFPKGKELWGWLTAGNGQGDDACGDCTGKKNVRRVAGSGQETEALGSNGEKAIKRGWVTDVWQSGKTSDKKERGRVAGLAGLEMNTQQQHQTRR